MNSHYGQMLQPREKRLKVSKACYTCRVKKIKCDGVQPCMQCKARNKVCSFSKDGTVERQLLEYEDQPQYKYRRLSLNTRSVPKNNNDMLRSIEQEKLRQTSEQLDKLSMMWPGEGKDNEWMVDVDLLSNGITQSQPQPKQHLDINIHLINLYFRYRHTIFPIFSKSIFYRLLDNQDALITPLLLNSMYCHAAHFSQDDAAKAQTYFKKASDLLFNTYLNEPSLSVITSLCLLATFESNYYSGDSVSQQRRYIYLDMACRMCYDLKLHKRYAFHQSGATPDEIELRKRVYWVCYCFDKLQYLMTGKPILLSSNPNTMDIDLPILVLGSDDPNEFEINTCFIEHIKLMQLCERVSEVHQIINNNNHQQQELEQYILNLDEQLVFWLSNLPHSLQWTPQNEMVIPTEPPMNALVAHLHLIFNFVHLSALKSTKCLIRKSNFIATNLTQLTYAMSEQPHLIMSFELASEAIISATRVHLINCSNTSENPRHARFMYQRSIRSLRILLQHRSINSIHDFANKLQFTIDDADNNLQEMKRNTSISPKIHALSPVIPKTNHNMKKSVQLDMIPQVYGIVSPASSTASAPLDNSYSRSSSNEMIYDQSNLTSTPFMKTSFIPTTSQLIQKPTYEEQGPMEMYSHFWSKTSMMDYNKIKDTSEDLYLWDKKQSDKKEKEVIPSRFGLGVYASAHQHHTDVISQHMPHVKTKNSNRPVLLNHFGQVIVANTNNNNNNNTSNSNTNDNNHV